MQNNSTYITQAVIKNAQENPLRSYVNVLDSKVEYARWKQDLVLSYNYMPLANIKEKLQNDRITYMKKMEQQQAKLKALVDNQQIMTLLKQLTGFRDKLKKHSESLEKKIVKCKIDNKELKNKLHQRRQKLKQLKRQKRQHIIIQLKEQGVTSARHIKSLLRSKSTLSRTQPHSIPNHHSSNTSLPSPPSNLYMSCITTLHNSLLASKKKKKSQVNQLLKHKTSLHQRNGNKNMSNLSVGLKQVGVKDIRQGNNSFINMRMMSNYNSVPARVGDHESNRDKDKVMDKDKDMDRDRDMDGNMSLREFMELGFDSLVKIIFEKGAHGEVLKMLLTQKK